MEFERGMVMEGKEFYNVLLIRKKHGKKLDWGLITHNELVQLWGYEFVIESNIAKLYDVSETEVKKKLDDWDINQNSVKKIKLEKEIKAKHAKIPLLIEDNEITERVNDLIESMESLTLEEENAVINHLIMNNENLNKIAKGNRFLEAYQIAIRG